MSIWSFEDALPSWGVRVVSSIFCGIPYIAPCRCSFLRYLSVYMLMEDEMAGRHHQCSGHELGQISGDGEGQGGQACCSPWGHKESDTTG